MSMPVTVDLLPETLTIHITRTRTGHCTAAAVIDGAEYVRWDPRPAASLLEAVTATVAVFVDGGSPAVDALHPAATHAAVASS